MQTIFSSNLVSLDEQSNFVLAKQFWIFYVAGAVLLCLTWLLKRGLDDGYIRTPDWRFNKKSPEVRPMNMN